MRLARLTWPQARTYFASNDTVLIGIGSIECHGRHNPLGTDTMAPDAILDSYEKLDPATLIAPTVPYGATDDLLGFPGTISLGVDGLTDIMLSITTQLYTYGIRRFVFVNGHGGNVKPLCIVCAELNKLGCHAALVNWWKLAPQLNPAWGGGHGDGMETSANLAIDPESVDLDAIAPEALRNDIGEGFRPVSWHAVEFEGVTVDFPRQLTRMASNGWVAEGHDVPPASASAELGRAMIDGTAEYLQRFVAALKQAPLPQPLCDEDELDAADAYIATLQ